MSEFLAQLDQWALGILMGICSLFGVQELPEAADPHWKVEQRWEKQPDGYYQLIISSETIQEECRSGKAKYVIFPQTYMATQEVFADGIRVYTNVMGEQWHIKSFLDRPVVSCDLISFSKKVDLKVLSYQKYFATVSFWPRGLEVYPKNQMFYTTAYAIVGILSAVTALIFFAIGYSLGQKSYHLLVIGAGLFLVMYSHYSALAEVLHVHIGHQLSLLGIAVIGYAILVEENINNLWFKWNWYLFFLLLAETTLSFSHPHTTQLFMVVNATVAIILVFICFVVEENMNRKIMLFFIFIFAGRDLYNSQIEREGFLNLSLLGMVITCFMAYRLIKGIYIRHVGMMIAHKKFENDSLLIEKMSTINFKVRQILHDMKSPVTSLNFMIASKKLNAEDAWIPIDRLNKLLKFSSEDKVGYLLDWYSTKILENAVDLIVNEKKFFATNILYHSTLNHLESVFFDPELVKVLVAELVDNSVKNNSNAIKIKITLDKSSEGNVLLKYQDFGVGMVPETASNLGLAGFTTSGSGIGMYSVFERVKEMGAVISVETSKDRGFSVLISFRSKSIQDEFAGR